LEFKKTNRNFDTQEKKIYHMKMEVMTLSEICESICRSFSKFEDAKELIGNHKSIDRRAKNVMAKRKKGKRQTIFCSLKARYCESARASREVVVHNLFVPK